MDMSARKMQSFKRSCWTGEEKEGREDKGMEEETVAGVVRRKEGLEEERESKRILEDVGL